MEAVNFVTSYQGEHPFILSLKKTIEKWGCLTPRQEEAALKFLPREKPMTAAPSHYDRTFSFKEGERFEIPKWRAKKLQAEFKLPMFFRNLEIVKVLSETPRAVQVVVKFTHQPGVNCHICGRDLDNDISRATGIGPVCASKLGIDRGTYEDAAKTLAAIQERCRVIGELGPIWMAKSLITRLQ